MPANARIWTADEVRALPDDGKRYEVIDGELFVTPAPRILHQSAVLELAVRLREYLEAERVGQALLSPADIEFEPRTLVQPDVFVVPLVDGRRPRTWTEIRGRLLLAAEVLSPSTARVDRTLKRRLYQREQVPEYWIVDVDARLVERWRPADNRPEILHEVIEWSPHATRPPMRIDLSAFFAQIHGE